jgi:hypothetical protein
MPVKAPASPAVLEAEINRSNLSDATKAYLIDLVERAVTMASTGVSVPVNPPPSWTDKVDPDDK